LKSDKIMSYFKVNAVAYLAVYEMSRDCRKWYLTNLAMLLATWPSF